MIYMWFEYCFVVVDVFMCGVVCVVDVVDVIVVVFGMYVQVWQQVVCGGMVVVCCFFGFGEFGKQLMVQLVYVGQCGSVLVLVQCLNELRCWWVCVRQNVLISGLSSQCSQDGWVWKWYVNFILVDLVVCLVKFQLLLKCLSIFGFLIILMVVICGGWYEMQCDIIVVFDWLWQNVLMLMLVVVLLSRQVLMRKLFQMSCCLQFCDYVNRCL